MISYIFPALVTASTFFSLTTASAVNLAALSISDDDGVTGNIINSSVTPSTNAQPSSHYLICTGALPATGYPTNLINTYRTNYTSLTDFCSIGCSCGASDSLECKNATQTNRAPDIFATVNSTAYQTCLSNCSCALSPPAEQTPETLVCEKGGFPAGKGPSDYGGYSRGNTSLACYADAAPLWTMVGKDFNASNAEICDPCPEGYGPVEGCLLQPTPLPGPCCEAGKPCYWAGTQNQTITS